MKPKGVFIYVDDDKEDHELFKMALSEICDNEVISAFDGDEAYELIHKHKNEIFLILSDMNMPKVTGMELKRMIENSPILKLKAIPFIFHTSADDPVIVKEAYALSIQGYMKKQHDYKKTVALLKHFVAFWSETLHPDYLMKSIHINRTDVK